MTSAPEPTTGAPSFSAEDIRIATELLTQPLDGAVKEIVTLTDEELTALDGLQHDALTPLPWMSESATDDEGRALLTAAAMRSMIARGIVTTGAVRDPRSDEDAPADEAVMVAVPELQGTMVLRRTSDAVIIAERRTERGLAYGYFYVFHLEGTVRVLWEAFDATGFHLFFLLDGDTLAEQLIAFVDPIEAIGEEDGEPQEVPAASFGDSEAAARLARSRAMSTLLVLGREDTDGPTAFTLFSTPDGVELMETAGEGDTAVQRVGAVSRATLTELIEDLVAAGDGTGADDQP